MIKILGIGLVLNELSGSIVIAQGGCGCGKS